MITSNDWKFEYLLQKALHQLKQRRWLLMPLFGLIVVIVEALEHINVDESLFTRHFAAEVIVYGITIPLVGAIILTLLDRVEKKHDELVIKLEHEVEVSSQLKIVDKRDDLIDMIVRMPKAILPVVSCALFLKYPDGSGFKLAKSIGYNNTDDHDSGLNIKQCQSCDLWSLPVTSIHRCSSNIDISSGAKTKRYCMPLFYGDYSIGILTYSIPKKHIITETQKNMLINFSNEMILALENVRLKELIQSQSDVSEAERERIAKDLHDTLAQNISYLRLKLDQISRQDSLLDITEIAEDLARMRDIADEAYTQIRGTLANLHPSSQLGLEEYLRSQAQKISARSDISVEYVTLGDPLPLPPHFMRQVLYICREALNNIEKHANASSAKIELQWAQQDLTITIEDDGSGFNSESLTDKDHFGLSIMTERALDINARISFDSKPYKGTKITLRLPLAPYQITAT